MESRVLRQRNVHVSDVHEEPPAKRRRAALGNLTNKDNAPSIIDGKKKTAPVKKVVSNAENKRPTEKRTRQSVTKQNSVKQPTQTTAKAVPAKPASTQSTSTARLNVGEAEIIDLCTRFDFIDVDKDNRDSPYHVTEYVNDIFKYYKQREAAFMIGDYMPRQLQLTGAMRAILVDWLVEVQQNFELHHETLYMAVKLTDRFLALQPVAKDRLQLLGATALLVSSKFEERSPPLVDDFLYICDDTYSREELLTMERTLLKAIGFDLGMPLSYTFLRRYAQCARVSLVTLTLARYILESSLLDYSFVCRSDSMMAAACLLLAMKMNSDGNWDSTMVHYSGFQVSSDLSLLSRQLNTMIRRLAIGTLKTVHTKYSHRVFHEVAKIATLSDERILEALPVSIPTLS